MKEALKHVVITGAGSGLGASLARKYSKEGYHVSLLGRTQEKLERVAASLEQPNYSSFTLDISSPEEVEKTFAKIVQEVQPVDILINNAGVGYFERAEDLTADQINQMIDINLKGTIFCTQAVLIPMIETDKGSIINVISTAGVEGKVTEAGYCASKFGVRGFTESLVKELEVTDIHVNAVYMGGMDTPFWGEPEEESSEEENGLMHPDDIADIIFENTKIRKNINVSEIIIKNH